jgi:competence protein ComFC
VQKMLHGLKYNFYHDLARTLVEVMAVKALEHRTLFADAVVTFVPLSRKRERWRGFNQAKLLAQGVGRLRGLPVKQLLERKENRHSQVGLDRQGRLTNLRNTISAAAGDLPPKVIVIDDVVTTGATLEECAAALKAGGVQRVYGYTLVSG